MVIPPLQRKAITLAFYATFREFPNIDRRMSKDGSTEVFECSSDGAGAQVETIETDYTYTAIVLPEKN